MPQRDESSRSSTRRAVATIVRYVWLPALLLLAIDLMVPPEQSVLRSSVSSLNYTINHHDAAADGSDDEHLHFGLDDSPSTANWMILGSESSSLGLWSAEFDASLPVEADAKCWSPTTFRLDLAQAGDQLSGSGSYEVEPAACSVLEEPRDIPVTVFGERQGGRVSLRLRDADSGDLLLTFDGLIMPKRLSGWFYRPDSQPASGPVTMKPSRG